MHITSKIIVDFLPIIFTIMGSVWKLVLHLQQINQSVILLTHNLETNHKQTLHSLSLHTDEIRELGNQVGVIDRRVTVLETKTW